MLCDHNTGQGHVRSPGKKGQTKRFRDLELRYMFFVSDFRKELENGPKTIFEASKSVKNKIWKITVKSRNDVKVPVFDIFYFISQLFLKIST